MAPTELREEIDRVIESGALHQSAVLRRILEYLGEAAVVGRPDVKEYTIGVEALGKSSSYDPQRDSTVRVQVAKLRQKLDEYYREQGGGHGMRISVPKGVYRLELETITIPRAPSRSRDRLLPYALALLAAIGIGVGAYFWGVRTGGRNAGVRAKQWSPEQRLFWQPIAGNGRPVVISYDVAMTVEAPPWKFRNPSLNDPEELAASPEWQELSRKLGRPAYRTEFPYVGFGIAHGTFLLSQLLTGQGPQMLLKRSTVLSWEDIAHSNLIFIGTGKTAKLRYILQRGDFQWDLTGITNLKPAPGEPREFVSAKDPRTGDYQEQFALISMLPGFDESTRVLVLGGGTAEGDWAAVESVTSLDYVGDLVGRMKNTTGQLPKAFQVVLKVRYESRVPVAINYVTHHVLSLAAGLGHQPAPK